MPNCADCGLFQVECGQATCVKHRGKVDLPQSDGCPDYMNIVWDGPTRLTPWQHRLLQEEDQRGRKMKGSV